MKKKIADWMYNFWYNNHTHWWDATDQRFIWEKCRKCGAMRNIKLMVPEEYFKQKQR